MIQGVREVFEIVDLNDQGRDRKEDEEEGEEKEQESGSQQQQQQQHQSRENGGKIVIIGRGLAGLPIDESLQFVLSNSNTQ